MCIERTPPSQEDAIRQRSPSTVPFKLSYTSGNRSPALPRHRLPPAATLRTMRDPDHETPRPKDALLGPRVVQRSRAIGEIQLITAGASIRRAKAARPGRGEVRAEGVNGAPGIVRDRIAPPSALRTFLESKLFGWGSERIELSPECAPGCFRLGLLFSDGRVVRVESEPSQIWGRMGVHDSLLWIGVQEAERPQRSRVRSPSTL